MKKTGKKHARRSLLVNVSWQGRDLGLYFGTEECSGSTWGFRLMIPNGAKPTGRLAPTGTVDAASVLVSCASLAAKEVRLGSASLAVRQELH